MWKVKVAKPHTGLDALADCIGGRWLIYVMIRYLRTH